MQALKMTIAVLAATFAASSAYAAAGDEMMELARARNCLACHQVKGSLIGPAYHDVALRYVGKPGSAEELAKKIRAGTSGAWGAVPMPANLQVSPAEALQLAQWVLTK